MLTTRRLKLIKKKEFTVEDFNLEDETFIIYIVFVTSSDSIHLSQKLQIALLKVHKIFIIVTPKYTDFVDVFF